MMDISPNILRRDTITLIKQIDLQIAELGKLGAETGVPRHEIRDKEGNWLMIPLLAAKAQAYNTLVMLQGKK